MLLKKFSLPLVGASALALFMMGCGDDSSSTSTSNADVSGEVSSSSVEGGAPLSSGSVDNPDQPGAADNGGDSGNAEPVVDETAETVVLDVTAGIEGCVTEPYEFAAGIKVVCDGVFEGIIQEDLDPAAYSPAETYSDFVSIRKVFDALQSSEKVIFVMRHGDRTSSTNSDGMLTGLGKYQARSVGEQLASDEEIFFAHSDYPRTLQTTENIAIGRKQSNFSHKTLDALGGGWYVADREKFKDYGQNNKNEQYVLTAWAYKDMFADAFYDIGERSEELISVLVAELASKHRISIACSHDQLILPLLVYLTDKQIELNYTLDGSWLNFLAGVAIIIDQNGNKRFVPIKGLDSGLQ